MLSENLPAKALLKLLDGTFEKTVKFSVAEVGYILRYFTVIRLGNPSGDTSLSIRIFSERIGFPDRALIIVRL